MKRDRDRPDRKTSDITETGGKGHDDLLSGIAITGFGVGCAKFERKRECWFWVVLFDDFGTAGTFSREYSRSMGSIQFHQWLRVDGSHTFKGSSDSFAVVKEVLCCRR